MAAIFEKAYVVAHGGNSYQTISASVTPHEAMTNMLGEVDEVTLGKEARQSDRFAEASSLEANRRRHLGPTYRSISRCRLESSASTLMPS